MRESAHARAARRRIGPGDRRGQRVDRARGPAVVASSGPSPQQVGHTPIDRVRVSGSGVVKGLNWLDAGAVAIPSGAPWRMMGLPIGKAKRYAGLGSNACGELPDGAAQGFLARRKDACALTEGGLDAVIRLDQSPSLIGHGRL